MGTPEERLRKRAAELSANREVREREEQEEDARRRAELKQLSQAATAEAQAWLERARVLVGATQMRVALSVDYHLGIGPGFQLTVGRAEIRLLLRSDGWRVAHASPASLHPQTGLPMDPAAIRDTVLERMVEQGLEDLNEGRVDPAPEWGR